MRRGGDYCQSGFPCQPGNYAAQTGDVDPRLLDVFADAGADLNHRLNHLGLNLLAENHLPFLEKLGHMRPQLTSLRINNLKFFLDP
jgi:hypothetical protein